MKKVFALLLALMLVLSLMPTVGAATNSLTFAGLEVYNHCDMYGVLELSDLFGEELRVGSMHYPDLGDVEALFVPYVPGQGASVYLKTSGSSPVTIQKTGGGMSQYADVISGEPFDVLVLSPEGSGNGNLMLEVNGQTKVVMFESIGNYDVFHHHAWFYTALAGNGFTYENYSTYDGVHSCAFQCTANDIHDVVVVPYISGQPTKLYLLPDSTVYDEITIIGGGFSGHAEVESKYNGTYYYYELTLDDTVSGTGNICLGTIDTDVMFVETAAQGGSYIWFGDDRMTIPAANPDICYHIPPTLENAGILRVEYVAPEDNPHNNQQPALRLVVESYEPGDELFWRQAYENGELPGGWLGFTVGIKAPQNSTGKSATLFGNGPFLEQAPLRTDFSGLELKQSQWTGGSLPIGSINVSGDRVQVVLSEMGDSNVLCASYWQPQSGNTPIQSFIYADTCIGDSGDEEDAYRVTFGRDVSAQRPVSKWVEMRYSPDRYNGILNEEVLTTTYDNRTNTITVMPKEGIDPGSISFGGNDLMKLTPPDGYVFNCWRMGNNYGGAYYNQPDNTWCLGWGQGPYAEVNAFRSITIEWWNEGTGDIIEEEINLHFLSRGITVDYSGFGGAQDWAPMGTRSGAAYGGLDVDKLKTKLNNSGIVLNYNKATGSFHISYSGVPSVDAMTAELEIKAPDNAVSYRETNMTGMSINWLSAAEQQFNMDGRKFQLNAAGIVTYPVTLYNLLKVSEADVYYTATTNEWMHLIQWLDKDDNVISTEYFCGQADDCFFETVTECYADNVETYVNENKFKAEQTEGGQPVAVAEPILIGGKGEVGGCSLSCQMFPQEGEDSYYFRLSLVGGNGNNGQKIIYLPYSFMGGNWDYAGVTAANLPAPVIHHFNDAHQQTETITGEYTAYGIRFVVNSFSPFTLNWEVPGDIDQSGTVNGDDLTMLLRYLAKIDTLTKEQEQFADVDGVSGVNAADATVLARMIKKQGK